MDAPPLRLFCDNCGKKRSTGSLAEAGDRCTCGDGTAGWTGSDARLAVTGPNVTATTPLAALSAACDRANTWHSPLCGVESDTYADLSPPRLLAAVRNGMDSEDKARVQALVDCVWQSVSPGSDCAWSSDADHLLGSRGCSRWTCPQSTVAADRGGQARRVANARDRKLHGCAALCAHSCVASCAPLCRHHFVLYPIITQGYI